MIKQQGVVEGNKLVMGYMGVILMLIGGAVLLPLIMLIPFPYELTYAKYFILPGTGSILTGYLLSFLVRGYAKGNLDKNQSALIVTLAWLLAIFVSACPFWMTGQYNFTQSMFEATSGWSTTGLSVVDVANTPHLFLFHRSLTLFFGGVGLVLIMLAVLTDSYGMRLYYAEGHPDKLLPNLIESSRMIMKLYMSYIGLGTLAYIIFGMNWFDALNHSIAAVATGGFSTKPENIGYYHSIPIEIISMILMLLGATNFVAALYMVKGRVKNFFRYCEVKFTIFILLAFIPLMSLLLWKMQGFGFWESFRIAAFQVISAFTCTGFQTVPTFSNWYGALILPMVLLMIIGGQSGSTAGGIKQYRALIALQGIYWALRDTFSGQHLVRANYVKKPDCDEIINDKQYGSICTFIFTYIAVFIIGVMVLCGFGYSLNEAMFEYSSAMGGVGLSAGITSYDANPVILWALNVGMFMGRLEIYVVIIAVVQLFKRK